MSNEQAEKTATFVLRAPPDFWWPVRVPIATDGDYSYAVLDCLFEALPQPELDKMRGVGLAKDEAMPSEDQIAKRVLKGWRRLPDEHGNPVPYSEAARDQLLAFPAFRTHLVATFLAASNGMAARKNA